MIKKYCEFRLDMYLDGKNISITINCKPVGPSLIDLIRIELPELPFTSKDLLKIDSDKLAESGSFLYKSFFVGDISGWLKQYFRDSKKDEGVRVAISSAPNMIYSFAWEGLYHPIVDFLALNPKTPIVRTPLGPQTNYKEDLYYPLNLLIIRFSPWNEEKIYLEFTNKIIEVLREAERKGQIKCDSLGFDSNEWIDYQAFQNYIQNKQDYDVVHIIAHGIKEAGHEGMIAFTNRDGERQDVKASDFGNLFRPKEVQLVLLQSCQSGSIDSDASNFSSVALQLLASGVPSVIAMQESIDQEVAGRFVEQFYERWLEDECLLEDALTQARSSVRADFPDSPACWAIPALYMASGISIRVHKKPKSINESTMRILEAAIKDNLRYEEKTEVLILIRRPESQGLREKFSAKPLDYEMSPANVRGGNEFNISFEINNTTGKYDDKALEIIISSDDFEVDQRERAIKISSQCDTLYSAIVKPIKKGPVMLSILIAEKIDGRTINLANLILKAKVGNEEEYVFRVNDSRVIKSQQLLNSGSDYLGQDRYIEAIQSYNKAIETDPECASAWNYRGNCLAFLEQYEEAAKAYDKAIELEPKKVEAWNNKGNVLINMMEYDEAINAYNKAIEIDPRYAGAWNNKGNAMALIFRYDEAIQAYDKAIEADRKYIDAWYNKGFSLLQLDRIDDALSAYRSVVSLDPSSAAGWNRIGSTLLIMNEHDDALKSFDEAIRINSTNSDAWSHKSVALMRQGRLSEARDIISGIAFEIQMNEASTLLKDSSINATIARDYSNVDLFGNRQRMLPNQEYWGRSGFVGLDRQDQFGPVNIYSYQSDEGNPLELRGANYPNYAMNVGHQGEYAGVSSAAHAGRMDAFAVNPLIKVTFANPGLVFGWADPRACFGKGGAREFRAAGDRAMVMPAV